MEILSLRDKSSGDATAAYVSVNGEFFCHSLEDVVREPATGRPEDESQLAAWVKTWKVYAQTAIIKGRYRVIIDYSEHFKKRMMHIMNVPGWDGVRCHGGLKPEDTEGCILLGDEEYQTDAGPRIKSGTTRPAVDRLFKLVEEAIDRGEEVWWEFKENPNA